MLYNLKNEKLLLKTCKIYFSPLFSFCKILVSKFETQVWWNIFLLRIYLVYKNFSKDIKNEANTQGVYTAS